MAAIPWVTAPSHAQRAAVAQGVSFARHTLPGPKEGEARTVRPVHPQLSGIQRWISTVGASVGAMDLRRQGHSGDACSTDPRDDKVRVMSVPGSSGTPFATFELTPPGLRHDATMAPIGCVPTDINQDGNQDVVVYYWGRSPVIFLNQGGAGAPNAAMFTAHELVTPMQVWNTTALNVADINGDGALDIFVGNYFPDGSKVLDPTAGPDSRFEMQHSMGKARNAGENRLYLGSRTTKPGELPTFTDVSNALPEESAKSWTLATGFQDLTGDRLPEIYVANDFGPDQLLVNKSTGHQVRFDMAKGTRDLVARRSAVLGHDSFKGMGVAYSYEANQALPRIFVSNITSPWALQESNLFFYPHGDATALQHSKAPYRDRSHELIVAQSGWSWDVKAVDLFNTGDDNILQVTGMIQGTRDVWPRLQELAMGNDLILSSPKVWMHFEPEDDLSGHEQNKIWARTEDGKYADIGAKAGFTAQEVSRGIAPADLNGDGRYDFTIANQWGPSYSYINQSDTRGQQLSLSVVRPAAHGNTPLVGATVTLHADTFTRQAQLYPANGHSGVADTNVHFGLPVGTDLTRLSVDVSWIDNGQRRTQTFPVRPGHQTLEVNHDQ